MSKSPNWKDYYHLRITNVVEFNIFFLMFIESQYEFQFFLMMFFLINAGMIH